MANEPHYEGPEVTETDNSCCEKDKNIQKIFIYHLLLKMMIVCNKKTQFIKHFMYLHFQKMVICQHYFFYGI